MKQIILYVTLSSLLFYVSITNEKTYGNNIVKYVDIKGVWNLTYYFDSCLQRKELYNYSLSAASYACQIIFDNNDSCLFNGYHESQYLPLKKIDSFTYKAGNDDKQFWILKFVQNDGSMILYMHEFVDTSYFESLRPDKRQYQYKKGNEKIENIPNFILTNLFIGKYRDKKTNNILELSADSRVSGLKGFKYYNVITDFLEYCPGSFDALYFSNDKGNLDVKHLYGWEFKGNLLIIRKLKGKYNDDSGLYEAQLSEIFMVLERMNN